MVQFYGLTSCCSPGKVIVEDVTEINNEKFFMLKFTQGRNPEWTNKTFLASYDDSASWIDGLTPAFGEENFYFGPELRRMYRS